MIGSIEFSEGIKTPLAEFIEVYKKTYPFCYLPIEQREKELEKAHKIATDGNIKPSLKKRKKSNSEQDRKDIVSGDKKDRNEDNKEKSRSDI